MSGVFDSISKVCLHYFKHESARKSVVGTAAAELPAAYTSPADFLQLLDVVTEPVAVERS